MSTFLVWTTTSAQHGLRSTEDFHSLRFTPVHALANEPEGLHGAARKKRSLVRGNLHTGSAVDHGADRLRGKHPT